MLSNFLGTCAATIPVPRGAGISRTRTDPHLPVTLLSKKSIQSGLVFVLGMVLTRSWQLPADHMVIEYTLLSPSTDHKGQEVSDSSSTQSPTHLTGKEVWDDRLNSEGNQVFRRLPTL